MVTTLTQEAHLALDKAVTKEDVLRLIPQFELRSILRRHHLNREIVAGLIGLRGDIKSGSGASISLIDFMLEGVPCYGNMDICCDIEIDDETAQKYGLSTGGIAHYASLPLDKEALLRFDPIFHRCLIFGDEINMELAEARRAMSNTNLWFANVGQELRHLESSLIYTVIDEMFIDSRLRTLTDFFIKTEDTAFSVEGLANKRTPGVDAKWIIYPMSGYLAGRENSYYVTKKPMSPVYFHFSRLWGIYDDKQMQAEGKPKYGIIFKKKDEGVMQGALSVDDSPTKEMYDAWGWLAEKAKGIKAAGITSLEPHQLAQVLGRPLTGKIKEWLKVWGISWDTYAQNYKIESFNLEDTHSLAVK